MTWHDQILERIERADGPVMLRDILGVWVYPSKSDVMGVHYVTAFEEVTGVRFVCSCEGFRFNDKCWHSDDAKAV